jgi:hypothetical protein
MPQDPGAQGTGKVAASTALPLNALAAVSSAATVMIENLRTRNAGRNIEFQFIMTP